MDIFADKPPELRGSTQDQVLQLHKFLCDFVDFMNIMAEPSGMGNVIDLNTSDKTSLVAAINEVLSGASPAMTARFG